MDCQYQKVFVKGFGRLPAGMCYCDINLRKEEINGDFPRCECINEEECKWLKMKKAEMLEIQSK